TNSAPVTHLTIGIPPSVSDDLRFTVATAQGVNLQVSKQGPTPSQNYTTLNVQFPASEMKFVFNVTTVFAGLLSYSPGANSFTFEANPFPRLDGSYNVTRAKITLQTGDWQVTDSYNVTHLGPTLSSLAFNVPTGVSSITENYVLGLEIDQPETTPPPTVNSDGTSTVTFTPSFGSVPFNLSFRAKIFY